MTRYIHPHILLLTGLLLCAFTSFTSANRLDTTQVLSPNHIEGSIKVGAEQVIELIESRDNLVIIDSRIESDRKQGFIEDSIGLTNIDTNCTTLSEHVEKTSYPVLFYCNGEKCGRSGDAVRIAKSCGYKQIYWFRNGIEEWIEKSLPLSYE